MANVMLGKERAMETATVQTQVRTGVARGSIQCTIRSRDAESRIAKSGKTGKKYRNTWDVKNQ